MPEQLVKVLTRRTTDGQISTWATLHLNTQGGTIAGWLCDAWTEAGTSGADVLLPRLHWLSKDDDRFHLVQLDIPVAGFASITLGPADENIEPRRERFMRDTLAQWENEYFTTQGVQVSIAS
ncbi:MAG: hypothetical protein WA817_12635 [Candidatus Acidiferrum sp.]